jgi:Secretion system C-terminal sorting domain
MKIRLLLINFLLMLISSTKAQLIQGTIRSGAPSSQIEVYIKPNFNNLNTRYLYQLGFPIAFPSGVTPTPTALTVTLDPGFISTFGSNYTVTVNPLSANTSGTEKYFNIVLLRGGAGSSNPQTWTSGTEYKVLTATFQGSLASAQVKLADYQDGGLDGQGAFFTQDDNNTYYVTSNSIGNFYASPDPGGSTVGGDASAGYSQTTAFITLPVNLLNFSGYKSGGKNVLNWTVSNEINNKGFDVLRSMDGVNYSSVGFVNSQAIGGVSNSELHYTFDDNSPVGKKQYYRLNQVDIDGKSKLSNIVMITRERTTTLLIGGLFPNPTRDKINVIIEAPQRDKVTVMITDMGGKIVKQQLENVDVGSNTVPVDVAKLASGSYLVKLICQSSDCETATGKFNKQ